MLLVFLFAGGLNFQPAKLALSEGTDWTETSNLQLHPRRQIYKLAISSPTTLTSVDFPLIDFTTIETSPYPYSLFVPYLQRLALVFFSTSRHSNPSKRDYDPRHSISAWKLVIVSLLSNDTRRHLRRKPQLYHIESIYVDHFLLPVHCNHLLSS